MDNVHIDMIDAAIAKCDSREKIAGEEKKHLTVEMLMNAFADASGEAFANDRILLS